MKRIIFALAGIATLSGCANSYSAQKAGVPYYVFRGFHLECVKQAQAQGKFRGKADADYMEQGAALLLGGVSGLVAYELAEPNAQDNNVYQQCMAQSGVAPRG
jgi:Prokaryotic membrane lipoprotein lipid attachment site